MSDWSDRITIKILDSVDIDSFEPTYREYIAGTGDATLATGDMDDFAEALYAALGQMDDIETRGLIGNYNSLFPEDNQPTFVTKDGPVYRGALDAALQNLSKGTELTIFIDPTLNSPAFADPFSYPPAIYLNPEKLDDIFYQIDIPNVDSDVPTYLHPTFISVLADELFHIADRRNTDIMYDDAEYVLANQNSIRSGDAYNALFNLPPRSLNYGSYCNTASHDRERPTGEVPLGDALGVWVAMRDGLDLQLDRIHYTHDMEPGALGGLPAQALPTAEELLEFEGAGCGRAGR